MGQDGAVVVVGGTRAIGLEIVKHYAARGDQVVLSGQSRESADRAVEEVGRENVHAAVFDLAHPRSIAPALAEVGPVRHLVLAAINRDSNSISDYDIDRAIRLVTLKLVGYATVVHSLLDRMSELLVEFRSLPRPGSAVAGLSMAGGQPR